MKLYTANAPSPFRVNVFIAEKGLQIDYEKIDIMAGETRTAEFSKLNSLNEVPVLVLDDGSLLTESVSICRYLETQFPEKPLLGRSALEAARIDMWNRRMEHQLMEPISCYGQHTVPFFSDKVEQIPAYAQSQLKRQHECWRWLNQELSDARDYIAGEHFSIADITGMAALLVCNFVEIDIPNEFVHLKAWEKRVQARPSWEKALIF